MGHTHTHTHTLTHLRWKVRNYALHCTIGQGVDLLTKAAWGNGTSPQKEGKLIPGQGFLSVLCDPGEVWTLFWSPRGLKQLISKGPSRCLWLRFWDIYFTKHAGGRGCDGEKWTEWPLDALLGLRSDVCTQSREASHGLILASQRSAVRVAGWWWSFPTCTHDAYHLLCRLLLKPERPPSLTKKGILVCSWQPSGWRLSICPGGCHLQTMARSRVALTWDARRGVTAVSPLGRGGCEPAAGMQEPCLERLWRILSCVDGVVLYRSESSKCLAHYCSFKKNYNDLLIHTKHRLISNLKWSERNQTQKVTHYIIPFLWPSKEDKT